MSGPGTGRRSGARAPEEAAGWEDEDLGEVDEEGTWWPRQRSASVVGRSDGGALTGSRRGPIVRSWWARRFLDIVGPLVGPDEAARARRRVRAGGVTPPVVTTGYLEATVGRAGAAPVTAGLRAADVDPAAWKPAVALLGQRAGHLARLVAGDLPAELETVLGGVGVELFPTDVGELAAHCSCSPWPGGCEHVMAACYLAAEAFDADPLVFLTWRGAHRDDLLGEVARWSPPTPAHGTEAVGARATAGPGPAGDGEPPAPGALARVAPGVVVLGGRELADLLAPSYRRMVGAAAEVAGQQPLSPPSEWRRGRGAGARP
jgi:uncharacterized Zn finger protein